MITKEDVHNAQDLYKRLRKTNYPGWNEAWIDAINLRHEYRIQERKTAISKARDISKLFNYGYGSITGEGSDLQEQ